MTNTILKAQLKVYEVLSGYNHILMSVSGGSDSDIMLDICKDSYSFQNHYDEYRKVNNEKYPKL